MCESKWCGGEPRIQLLQQYIVVLYKQNNLPSVSYRIKSVIL